MTRIAVTGLSAGESPSPGLGVIRSIREHPGWTGKIIGLAYDAYESGVFASRLVDSVYLLPYSTAGSDALLERIAEIHSKERIDAILPNLDVELPNFIRIQKKLNDLGIRLFLPSEEQFKRRSKAQLMQCAAEAAVRTPDTMVLAGPPTDELKKQALPAVVKGLFYDAQVVYTHAELMQAIHRMASYWGYPVLVQQFIPGEEFNAIALGDGTGETIGALCMKKLVMTEKKKGWVCVTIENPELERIIRALVRTLKWRGPMEIEAIHSKEDGRFYVFEINPRFPQWIYLSKAAGANFPYSYLQLALGDEPQMSRHRPGVLFSNCTMNLITDLASLGSLFTNGELHYAQNVHEANL